MNEAVCAYRLPAINSLYFRPGVVKQHTVSCRYLTIEAEKNETWSHKLLHHTKFRFWFSKRNSQVFIANVMYLIEPLAPLKEYVLGIFSMVDVMSTDLVLKDHISTAKHPVTKCHKHPKRGVGKEMSQK